MLARSGELRAAFTRRDAARLGAAAAVFIVAVGAILSIDSLPGPFAGPAAIVGDVATVDIRAPRSATFESVVATRQLQDKARADVAPQYNFSAARARELADQQVVQFEQTVAPVDAAFEAVLTPEARAVALLNALPNISTSARNTLAGLDQVAWTALRGEMVRLLELTELQEVRDTLLADVRGALAGQIGDRFNPQQQALAAEIIAPLVVANSTYDAAATEAARTSAAAAVEPVRFTIRKGEIVVQSGERIDDLAREKLQNFGLLDPQPDLARVAGWFLLAALVVALLLSWLWRFRPEFWHRNSALLLIGLILILAVAAFKATGDRSVLPYFVPAAAVGLLLTVLLDSGVATLVMGILAIVAGAIVGSLDFATYVFLGSMAGITLVRRGERVGHFVQAAIGMAVVNVMVVTLFALLGERDVTGLLQLAGAGLLAAGGSAVAAVGTFALLGNIFGITTSFQLLELGNPSQPLLRRLLLETPGTYHHSLMVGNLAERAAEAVGADPLLTRVAAYYHDVGKLNNPLGYIENQAGMGNIHDELTPEQSVALLKSHVAGGIDLAYQFKVPKAIIAFIPQHHGTALMSYFFARAKEQAIEAAGVPPNSPQAAEATAKVDPARFRHAGPKPQSREAAILMLADSVEASVRSLTSQDEPTIRAMVDRIIRERLEDGQFDDCDLTLRDLEHVREAFVAQLLGMYHRRVEYPQNKIVEIESRRASGRTG
jgi:putative nucleotidyltransferase with HDIG domain